MFNLFGSLFFGQRPTNATSNNIDEEQANTNVMTNEASTQTSIKQTMHTQTSQVELSNLIQMRDNEEEEEQEAKQYSPFIGPLNYNEYHQHNQSSNDWVIVDRSEEADKCYYNNNNNNTSRILQQHNILSAEAGINTSTIMQQDNNEQTQSETVIASNMQLDENKMFERADDDNEIILGSFFEKNETETEEEIQRYMNHESDEESDNEQIDQDQQQVEKIQTAQTTTNDWQITPLPCLTSTTWSQRSIVTEDPLENLLIEHPSMSVFVSATSSNANSERKNSHQKKPKSQKCVNAIDEDESDDMLTMLFKTSENSSTEVKAVVLRKPLSIVKINNKPAVASSSELVKKPAEKRKESETICSNHRMISVVNNFHNGSISPPPMLRAKKGKKNKKSASSNGSSSVSSLSTSPNGILAQSPIGPHTKPVSFNKENQQVKTLLLNEFKRGGSGCMGAHIRSIDPVALLNKNQMKRANKNSAYSSSKNLNQKQRKYHKLQQPAAYSTASNMQF